MVALCAHLWRVLWHLLAAKGFQFGGVQIIPPSTGFETIAEGVAFKPYKSSDLWNYEVGARSEWWDRRLQLDATVLANTLSYDVRGVAGIETCNGCDYQDISFVQPRTGLVSLTFTF